MFRIHFNKRILAGFFLALMLLAWLAYYSYQNTQTLISSSRRVAHSHDVLYHAEQILVGASSIEIGQRGYALTGNEKFLEPYIKARTQIYKHIDELNRRVQDSPEQRKILKDLHPAIDELLLFATSAVKLRKRGFTEAQQFNASMKGKAAIENIRNIITTFENNEKKLLSGRILENEHQITRFNAAFVGLLLVVGLVLIIVFYMINVNLRARDETEQKLIKASEEIKDLYDNSPCGYHSLNNDGEFVEMNNTMLKWLGFKNRDEVVGRLRFKDVIHEDDVLVYERNYPAFKERGYVHDIEFNLKRIDGTALPVILSSSALYDSNGRFLKTRSNVFDNSARKVAENKIKELNQELEAFTYSVSHDLRAPLRSIDGYARILREDYNDKLDDEGRRVIAVIMNNAKRMGQLIDDLLDFARLGRKEVARSKIDMTRMVTTIADELRQESDRSVDFVIHDLHPAVVDVEMIRQVWINLISNAIKYTGKTDYPKIEIRSEIKDVGICYQIKDNGVGFDMQYAHKLFGVFQRLHKMQDFSGTGVGLAIVKKIIDRHDGKVWGEAKLNQGAIFYFTIPQSNG